jgi:hypothetical protein
LNELVRLKNGIDDPTCFLAQLYASALEEWADRLGMDPFHLNKLVLIRENVPDHHWQEDLFTPSRLVALRKVVP